MDIVSLVKVFFAGIAGASLVFAALINGWFGLPKLKAEAGKISAETKGLDVDVEHKRYKNLTDQIDFWKGQAQMFQGLYTSEQEKSSQAMALLVQKETKCEDKIEQLEKKVDDLTQRLNQYEIKYGLL